MAKAQEKNLQVKEQKDSKTKGKERKDKNGDALIGRVKKVIKKSRRKLSEEKFEKQLQRTIAFLEELQARLVESHVSVSDAGKQKKARNRKKVKPNNAGGKTRTSAAAVKASTAAARSVK